MQVESCIGTAAAAGLFAYVITQQTLVSLADPPDMYFDTVNYDLKINIMLPHRVLLLSEVEPCP